MRFRLAIQLGMPGWKSWLLNEAGQFIREQQSRSIQSIPRGPVAPMSSTTDCVWRYSSPMEDYNSRWVPHRIVRRTDQAVLVEASPLPGTHGSGTRATSRPSGTYWVDRRELNRLGFARVRSRKTVFFTRPQASNRIVTTVDALHRLGLWFPYSEEDLKQAFRQRARQDHPDAGGSEKRFLQLQDDYERALAALDDGWWKS